MTDRPIPGPARLWILFLALAGLVALFGWWGDTRLRDTLESRLKTELETTLHANVTALEIWITNQTRLATSLARDPALIPLAAKPLLAERSAMRDAGRSGGPPAPREAEGADAYLQSRMQGLGYEAILVSTNLDVVASSGRGRLRLGMPVFDELQPKFAQLFETGQPILITPFRPPMPRRDRFRPPGEDWGGRLEWRTNRPLREPTGSWSPPSTSRPAWGPGDRGGDGLTNRPSPRDITLMQVAAPVRDDRGGLLGALALIIDPEKEFSRILSVARFGETGETYAFDGNGLMISRSRFDAQLKDLGLVKDQPEASSALSLTLVDPGGDLTQGYVAPQGAGEGWLIRFVDLALAGADGVAVRPDRDYRGVPVVAAWQWLPQQGFGVVTQMDAREAYQPLRVLQLLFLSLFLLLVLCGTGLFLASYLGVRWRRRLTEVELKARRLGQYQLEEKIGEGGMGVVYRARHALLRRDTAVKLLLPDRADPAAIERFEREVQLTCRLAHPNTIQVYDYGHTPEGLFYYAMEYLQGLNLKELVSRFGPQSEDRVIHILTQICEALHEAHDCGLVHRDIKPANVFLTNRGGVPDSVKVLDFGLVAEYRHDVSDPADRKERGFLGTPLFSSPESIRSPGRSDPRSDLYSVAALGWYLLTARHVFEGDTIEQVTRRHLEESPEPASRHTSNRISPELDRLLLECLDKDPQLRPASAADLKARLLRCPHAGAWDLAARAAWWARYEPILRGAKLASPDRPEAHEATAHMDMTVRLP